MARKHSSSSNVATAGRSRPAATRASNGRTPRPGTPHTTAAAGAAEPDVRRLAGIRSTLTTKSQTTVPRGVRDALHIGPGDELEYEIRGDEALIRRASRADATEDPVLLAFLDLLERDLACHPEHARPLPAALLGRMRAIAEASGRISRDEVIDGAVAL